MSHAIASREDPMITPQVPPVSLTEEEAHEAVRNALEVGYGPGSATLLETKSGMIPGAADVAYMATDVLYGLTGILDDDYPFACKCDMTGICEEDPLQTSCKGRPGDNAAVRRAGSGPAAIAALGALV